MPVDIRLGMSSVRTLNRGILILHQTPTLACELKSASFPRRQSQAMFATARHVYADKL
ncbi:hypothetical protein SAMN04490202_1865 [Pseudomonas reinekei]|uniref:Uncharacterized protein n=1 Tax=Pseudomonas reinekei TaxID=395598 RepID=A0A1H0MEG7_PSERE|nr:hypothetical protein SAMN04490202_1865 [Pseudomonas reinekei]